MASEVKTDKLSQRGSSGIVISDDIKLSSGKAIKQADGTDLLTEAGAYGDVKLASGKAIKQADGTDLLTEAGLLTPASDVKLASGTAIKNASGTALLSEDGVLPAGVTGGAGLDPRGVAVVDYWWVSTTASNTGFNVVTANWERVDTNSGGSFVIGSGITESSGIFSFPETGIYLIMANSYVYGTNANNYVGLEIGVTIDNSNWDQGSVTYDGTPSGSSHHASLFVRHIFNCESISTHKFRIRINSPAQTGYFGSATHNCFGLSVIKLN